MFFLPFAVHCHQPVGNFEEIFKKATEECYEPFLKTVNEYPFFRFSLHFSGPLWEWFSEKRPKLIDIIGNMVARGQIELLLGGFYEPLLPFIPEKDAREQILYMKGYLKEKFGYSPTGIWLTERVWTPELPKLLAPLGIKYTLLDDAHFLNAGLSSHEIHGYFITEKEGYHLFIFPISKDLRYAIPFKLPEELLQHYQQFFSQTPGHTLTYGDDGEKFGLWPKTYQWVYQKGWLKNFLKFLKRHQDDITVLPLGEYLKHYPPRRRIYLPPASYEEMMEWALDPDKALAYQRIKQELQKRPDWTNIRPFLRGSTWDNFLCKYEETNLMHKKMIFFSQRLSPNSPLNIKKYLWRSQCNCGYWHGIFGGLYLGHLRSAIFQNLIRFQKHIYPKTSLDITDYDCDGHKEILVHSPTFNAYFKPHYGGSLIELDWVTQKLNLTNVLTRRQEAYHQKIRNFLKKCQQQDQEVKTIHEQFEIKEPHLEKYLIYDWHQRFSFLDHFWQPGLSLEDFYQARYHDAGNFTIEPYKIKETIQNQGKIIITLERNGLLFEKYPLNILKRFTLLPEQNRILLDYILKPSHSTEVVWATELNLFIPEWEIIAQDKSLLSKQKTEICGIKSIELKGNNQEKIVISQNTTFSFWMFPIETVSLSESGAERSYQGTCLTLLKKISIKKGQPFTASLELKFINP